MRERRRNLRPADRNLAARAIPVIGILAALSLPAVFQSSVSQATDHHTPASAPSILLIVTDDQRWDTLWAMPQVRRLITDKGTTFDNAFVVNPLCCPSRSSILTGNYSHTTGVYRETPPFGAFPSFRDGSTIATWLRSKGYSTALFGKYIDGYQHAALTGYVPPGWDRWVAFVRSKYQDYKLTVDGAIRSYGSTPADYSTNVLGGFADRFIRQTAGPIFVEYAPAAPHAPATPESRFAGSFASLPPWRPPSFDERDVSDKPSYIRDTSPLDAEARSAVDLFRRDQYRTLLSVDRQIRVLIHALRDTGRLHKTLIIFTSDNGLSWGEHRWVKKEVPYEESIRVPLAVRYDPLTATGSPQRSEALALNIDIAPTIAAVAGVPASTDGHSLLPLLSNPASSNWRRRFLIEHMEGTNPVPTYCAVRTKRYLYARYVTGEQELYDLRVDPYEMTNIANSSHGLATELLHELNTLCVPAPPGYDRREGGAIAAAFTMVSLVLGTLTRRSRAVRVASARTRTSRRSRSRG
jgi:arylsulfatase A-like enzyme